MRPPRDAQGAECARLAPAQTEATEDRLLPLGQERSDPAQASGHLERPDLEVGAGIAPAAEDTIGLIVVHAEQGSACAYFHASI